MPADRPAVFFDTSVLLYLISQDTAKARRLDPHLAQGGIVSVQVLNEITNVARRKHGLPIDRVRAFLAALRDVLDVVPLTLDMHEAGLRLIERYKLSTYDAMIVAAALQNGCETLLSEDMQAGMIFEGRLQLVNPFE